MAYKKPWRVAGLLALGILVGYVIGPPIVQAATSLVTIQGGGSTHKAKVNASGQLSVNTEAAVNKAGQLLTGQAAPSNYKSIFMLSTTDCTTPGFTVPAGKALIVSETTFFLFNNTPGSGVDILLTTGAPGTCTAFVAAGATSNAVETVNQSYPTGIPIPTGTELHAVSEGDGGGSMFVYGYLVPAGSVALQQGKALPRIGSSGSLAH